MILDSLVFDQLVPSPGLAPPGEARAILARHVGWMDKLTRDALAAPDARQFDRRCRHLAFEVRTMLREGGVDEASRRFYSEEIVERLLGVWSDKKGQ